MRKRFKIPLLGMVLLILVVVVGTVLLFKSHILENWVNRFLAERLAAQYDLDISIAEIDGSFVNGFTLRGVMFRSFQVGDTITLAYLPSVTIKYQVSNLWHQRWIIDSLCFVQPQLVLKQDSSGLWVLPKIAASAGSTGALPSWEIKRLSIDSASLDLSLAEKKLRWFDIGLTASLKSEEGTYTLDLERLRFDSDDGRLRVRSLTGLATIFDKNLALSNVVVVTDSSRAAFSLAADRRDTLRVEMQIDSAHVHLPDVVSFLGLSLQGDFDLTGTISRQPDRWAGELSLSGKLEGRQLESLATTLHFDDGVLYLDTLSGMVLGGCRIDASGAIDIKSSPPSYLLSARVDSFDLDHLVAGSFRSDLSGRLNLDGRGLTSKTLAIDLDLDLDESFFDIYHMHSAQGKMTVTAGGLFFFPDFLITYHGNRFVFAGSVDYAGEVNITTRADLPNLAAFAHQTFIDLPAGRGVADFSLSGPAKDPDLEGEFRSDSLWLYQFFSKDFTANFAIHSFVREKRGPITVAARAGTAWDFPYDSLWAGLTLDSNLLIIDSGHIANSFSQSRLRGTLDYLLYPQVLTIDSIGIVLTGRSFSSDSHQQIRVDSSGFMFDRVLMTTRDGRIGFTGRANYDRTLDINWDVRRIDIAPWLSLMGDSLPMDGRLSSAGRVYGSIDNPRFEMTGAVDSLRFRSLVLGNLRGYLGYRDSALTIDSMFLVSQEGRYSASGELPINLTPSPNHKLFNDRSQHIKIYAQDKQLNLAATLTQSVEYIRGDFDAEIDLTGQPLKPHLNGTARLKNGIIKTLDLRDRLEQVDLEVTMADQLLTIATATAIIPHRKGKGQGTATASGTVFVNDVNNFTYDLSATCSNMPIDYEMGDFNGLANADLQVKGSSPPKVTGKIVMPSANYLENFSEESSGFSLLAALEGDKTWDLDLNMEFPSNFWVKNSDIDAEFSGQIEILRAAGVYNFLGSLEVVRGKYFLLDKKFTIEPGGQITYNNIEQPDPQLALNVSTQVRSQSRFSAFETQGSYTFDLNLTISGTLSNPIIAGDVSSENIIPTLLTNYSPSDTLRGNPVTQRITIGSVGMLASQVSRLGTRRLGVETFEIDPGLGKTFDPLNTRLTIGTYTLPNLYVFGSSTLALEKGQEVGAEFRLGRHYFFEGRRDESNLYHLNLTLHWEY